MYTRWVIKQREIAGITLNCSAKHEIGREIVERMRAQDMTSLGATPVWHCLVFFVIIERVIIGPGPSAQ